MNEATPKRAWPHLPNAPIREAVLDIQVALPQSMPLRRVESIHELVKDQYPKKRMRKHLRTTFDPASGSFRPAVPKTDGYVFGTEDQRQFFQARLDGFTVNRLAPYATWEALRDEAKRLWAVYKDAVTPEAIRRIGLRYVNRLLLPLPLEIGFKEYVLTTPDIGGDLPHSVSAFFMRLVVPQPSGVIAIITETLEEVEKRASGELLLPFIFDIDVFRQKENLLDSEALWEKFEELRDTKNEIFFKTITPKAEALFQ